MQRALEPHEVGSLGPEPSSVGRWRWPLLGYIRTESRGLLAVLSLVPSLVSQVSRGSLLDASLAVVSSFLDACSLWYALHHPPNRPPPKFLHPLPSPLHLSPLALTSLHSVAAAWKSRTVLRRSDPERNSQGLDAVISWGGESSPSLGCHHLLCMLVTKVG